MFKDNLIALRKMNGLSQEELAAKINVSRQTLSKYEAGESLPDVEKCKQIADAFEVSLDDLVNYDSKDTGLGVPPKGKHMFGVVKVGDKGQIVIPKDARKIYGLESGDALLVLGDSNGIALVKTEIFQSVISNVMEGFQK